MKKILLFIIQFLVFFSLNAIAKVSPIELTQRSAETQIRHILEPLLEKYCAEECKLMSIHANVDITTSDSMEPGFEEIDSTKSELAPSSAQVKILINDKVGPISRSKLLDLLQLYLDSLDYPVTIETKITHFPVPQGAEGKAIQLRDKVSKQFKNTVEDLLKQFCPDHCLLTDFDIQTELVNGEEAQYGQSGDFFQDGDTSIRIKDISATLLMDESMSPSEQANILEMTKLKTNSFKHVTLNRKSIKFPRPGSLTEEGIRLEALGKKGYGLSQLDPNNPNRNNSDTKNSNESRDTKDSTSKSSQSTTSNNNLNDTKHEKFERFEKIERVESGDAVQSELQKFKVYGLIFSASIIALLIFIALASYAPKRSKNSEAPVHRFIQNLASDPTASRPSEAASSGALSHDEARNRTISKRYEIERILEELTSIYAEQPKVTKYVFSRILTEEGVEVTAECIHLFGEAIVVDMLRDPSLQTDVSELMEYYARNTVELSDDEKLELLRRLHNRTVTGKLAIIGNRSSNTFEFLGEMDAAQIFELIRSESITVKAIVLTQCDNQKRSNIYNQIDSDSRMKLLTELSRIDHLPRDYIQNTASALKRKVRENPRLNTEALPGSEVLVSLLENTGHSIQRSVIKSLETTNPESARTVKNKLISIDTLKYLRDGQLLEVVLSLKHEELLLFLQGAPQEVVDTVYAKAPKELVVELQEELAVSGNLSRDTYQQTERKVLNRIKVMANDGQINLLETNERMFMDLQGNGGFKTATSEFEVTKTTTSEIRKAAGW